MSQAYHYSVSEDFPNEKVDAGRLAQEIRDSSIETSLEGVLVEGDDCAITFRASLSQGDEATLDSVVANHSGEPLETPEVLNARIIELDPDSDWDPKLVRTRYEGHLIQSYSGEPVSQWSAVYDHDIQVVSGQAWLPPDDPSWSQDDHLSFFIDFGVIGVVVAPAQEGDTEVYVNDTVLANIKSELYVVFDDLPGAYRVDEVDHVNGKLILETPIEGALSVMDPVGLRVYMLHEWPVYRGVVQYFAADTPGAAMIPSGYPLVMEWYHGTTPAADFSRRFGLVQKYMPE